MTYDREHERQRNKAMTKLVEDICLQPPRPPVLLEEKKDDYWLGNSPMKENMAIFIGHLVLDLLKTGHSIVRIEEHEKGFRIEDGKTIEFRLSVNDFHAATRIDWRDVQLVRHPRAYAQNNAEDLKNMVSRLMREKNLPKTTE